MYEEMYRKLSAAVAGAMDLIEGQKYQEALNILEKGSKEAEEIYIGQ